MALRYLPVHGNARRLHAGGGPPPLNSDGVLQPQHIVLHLVQADDAVHLGLHFFQVGGVFPGQNSQQVGLFPAVEGGQHLPVLPRFQGDGGGFAAPQLVLRQGGKALFAELRQTAHSRFALLGNQVRKALAGHGEGPAQPLFGLAGQLVQLPPGDGQQLFPAEGRGLALVPHRGGKGRAQQPRQLVFAPRAEEHKVLVPRAQRAHRAGGQGGAGLHQQALLQHIAAGQPGAAAHRQLGQQREAPRVALLRVFKGQHRVGPGQRSVEVLQKKFFLGRAAVEGKVHPGDAPGQQALVLQRLHRLGEGEVPPPARPAG